MASPNSATLWYLAYGANMSAAKFTGSRGIVPLASARVRVPAWSLAFNIPGLPYSEPCFTSIVPTLSPAPPSPPPDVLGVAYLITQEQYVQVIGSEGGGIAYDDIEVEAVPVGQVDRELVGERVIVRTLGPALRRSPCGRPSRRYMVSGASSCWRYWFRIWWEPRAKLMPQGEGRKRCT